MKSEVRTRKSEVVLTQIMSSETPPVIPPSSGAPPAEAASGGHGNTSDFPPPTSHLEAVAAVESHFRAVVAKDAAEIVGRYVPRQDLYVFVEGPRWSTVGHDAVATGWRAFCAAAMSVRAIDWVEGPRAGVTGEMAWVAGVVDLSVAFADGGQRTVRLRGTHVLERTASGWQVAHEHFSQPAPDPYGIGDWLPAKSEGGRAKADVKDSPES